MRGVGEAVEAERQADADGHREPLAQRAGRDLDPGRPGHVGMPLKVGADLAKAHQVLRREVTVLGQGGVLDRRRVALGEDEAVALRPVRVLRVVAENPVVEGGDDVGGRERAVEVPGLGDREHPDAVHPEDGRVALELVDRGLCAGRRGRLGVGNGLQVRHLALSSRLRVRSRPGPRPAQDGSARVAALDTTRRLFAGADGISRRIEACRPSSLAGAVRAGTVSSRCFAGAGARRLGLDSGDDGERERDDGADSRDRAGEPAARGDRDAEERAEAGPEAEASPEDPAPGAGNR